MSSLTDLPEEIIVEIALNLPKPQDAKYFSSACRSLRKALGQSNRLFWWHVWRKMRWMPDGPASAFCTNIDYWQRVTDALVPHPNDPKTCFKCFVQTSPTSILSIDPIYYSGGKFYCALCLECLEREFWIVDLLKLNYLDITPPPEMYATINVHIYGTLRYMGIIREAKNPNKWIHRDDAISFAKATLPPEETSDYGVFMARWIYSWDEAVRRNDLDIRREQAEREGAGKEHLYTLDFHLGVGKIVHDMISNMVKVYAEEYKQLHVINLPQEFGQILMEDAFAEVTLGGSYESKLVLNTIITDYSTDDPRPGTNNMSVNITHFATKEHEACVSKGRPPSDLSDVYRDILSQHFGVPCDSEHKLSAKIAPNRHRHVLRRWFGDLFYRRYGRKVDWTKLPLRDNFDFECPFCGIFTALKEDPSFGHLGYKKELFVEHIFEEHHEKLGVSWNRNFDNGPPDIYEHCDEGEWVKLEYLVPNWVDTPPSESDCDVERLGRAPSLVSFLTYV